jgi:hypothetical protein
MPGNEPSEGRGPSESPTQGPLRLFLSYAHEDAGLLDELRKHLAPLHHERIIEDWYDRELLPGATWNQEISDRLESADIVLALISADFIASEYAYGRELTRALELHRQHRLALVPVIARPCHWKPLPIAELQLLPGEARPIQGTGDDSERESRLVEVVEGVERVAQQLVSSRTSLADEWVEARIVRRRILKKVQGLLHGLGYYRGPLDGIPGPLTEAAVVAFQKAENLDVDALIGPEVIRRLEISAGR